MWNSGPGRVPLTILLPSCKMNTSLRRKRSPGTQSAPKVEYGSHHWVSLQEQQRDYVRKCMSTS